MKKILVLMSLLVFTSFSFEKQELTKKERKYAADLLKDTRKGVEDAVRDLSDRQLKFKPSADAWSVEECLKHIAVSELNLWDMARKSLGESPNPEKRSEIKASDEDLVKNMSDRSNKFKTMTPFEPQNTKFKTAEEALIVFKENRNALIEYVKKTNDDMRNHVLTLPMGAYDTYQMLLFIAAHSDRHTQQINEVKADKNFPKF